MATHDTHTVEIAGLKRDLRLFEVAPGLRIYPKHLGGYRTCAGLCQGVEQKTQKH